MGKARKSLARIAALPDGEKKPPVLRLQRSHAASRPACSVAANLHAMEIDRASTLMPVLNRQHGPKRHRMGRPRKCPDRRARPNDRGSMRNTSR